MNYSFASSINFGNSKGYDYFLHNPLNKSFCLSDGANSALFSNFASKLACHELTKIDSSSIDEIYSSYSRLDKLLIETHPGTACTSAHIKLFNKSVMASYCGDTLIEVYQYKNKSFFSFGASKWSKAWENPLDELEDHSGPSQLLGCNAFIKAHVEILDVNFPLLILMSTDGLHRYTSSEDRLYQISQVKSDRPSENDLLFICETLSQVALAAGSTDDISIASIWFSPI